MWLYRLQQRLSITKVEGNVLLVIGGLLLLGAGIQHFTSSSPALPEGIYEEVDRAFDEARATVDPVEQPAEREESAGTAQAQEEEEFAVPVNSATVIELQQLPGIGPALAERIVAYREEQGAFSEIEELTSVRGIGPRTLEGLEAYVVLD